MGVGPKNILLDIGIRSRNILPSVRVRPK
jgi:hypothetical protein